MDKKKIIQIVGFTLLVILIAWMMWVMFWREDPTELVNVNGEMIPRSQLPNINEGRPDIFNGNVNGFLPGVGNQNTNVPVNANTPVNTNTAVEPEINDRAVGGLTLVHNVVRDKVQDAVVTTDGQGFQFYNQNDNKFYRLQTDGTVALLSDKEFYDVDKTSWSADGDKAILEYPDGSNILYDFNEEKQYTLPKPMTEFKFSNSDDQIAFKWLSEYQEDNWLGISNPDGTNIDYIEPMVDKEYDVQVEWSPNSQVIALYREGSGYDSMDVYLVGQHGENFKSLPVRGRGFEGEWLDDGQRLMYSIYSESTGSRPHLWITRADGENVGVGNQPIGLQTWIDKCTFSGGSAYCAVPESLPEGAGYVPEIADTIPDIFYKIDLETGAKTLLARPVGDRNSYTASQLMVTADEDKLYFIDKNTGQLNNINL